MTTKNNINLIFLSVFLYPVVASSNLNASSTLSPSEQVRTLVLAYSNEFVFSPRKHKWYAYDGQGHVINSGRASGGRSSYCPDTGRHCRTPVGHFSIHSKGSASCRSTRYPVGRGGSPMPYCMFFTKYYAVHGSYELPANGNASHGCIRVRPEAARWLSRNFMRIGTRVTVLPY